MASDVTNTTITALKICESCKTVPSVVFLRHRHLCNPCALKFILQKFKRQMGQITSFFEFERRDIKGHISKILIFADAKPASEALIGMLKAYYLKDGLQTQEKFLENRLPFVEILMIGKEESTIEKFDCKWIKVRKIGLRELSGNTVKLTFQSGNVFQILLSQPLMRDVLDSFKSDSRDEAFSILRAKSVSDYALRNNYDVIIYPDTATQIASKVLALTAQGRGFIVPWECGALVKLPNGVYSARPMKDLSDMEIMTYLNIVSNSANDSTSSSYKGTIDEPPVINSINNIMSTYISGIETSFPSIVATTGRTADKLDFPGMGKIRPLCLVCSMPKQPDNVRSWLDTITVRETVPEDGMADKTENEDPQRKEWKNVTGQLCYGCYRLFHSVEGIVEWPV